MKLENAPTQQMKEKFESDMKKDLKKLQRLRDFFRSNQNNPDIKDKSKLDQGRKMIENVSSNKLTKIINAVFRKWSALGSLKRNSR